jgi:hypothetical protein
MPYRPVQHQISAIAVAKVREIWANTGAAVEEVRQDYGEDLLVQTCLNGRMDDSRLWVQVKGTQHASGMDQPDRTCRICVRADVALRWVRSADLLVLIYWDVSKNTGWYAIPWYTAAHSELSARGDRETSLIISSNDVFDANAAQRISWKGRLEHLNRFVRSFRALEKELREGDPEGAAWADEAIYTAVMDRLIDLNVIEPFKGDRQMLQASQRFRDCAKEAIQSSYEEGDSKESLLVKTITLAVLSAAQDVSGCGLSGSLLKEMAPVVEVILTARRNI